jgi:hypothetical protein
MSPGSVGYTDDRGTVVSAYSWAWFSGRPEVAPGGLTRVAGAHRAC